MYCASSFLRFCIAEAHGVWGFPPSSAGWTSFLVSLFRNCSTLSEQINVMSQKKGRKQIFVNKSFSCWTQQNHFFCHKQKIMDESNLKKQFWNCKRSLYRFGNMTIWQYGNMASKKKHISICHIDWDMFRLMNWL